MAYMTDIRLANDPTIKRIVQTAFPEYRKRTAWLSAFRGPMNINSYWDGGTRDVYAIVDLSTMARGNMPSVGHPYYEVRGRGIGAGQDEYVIVDHVGNVQLKDLPAGFVIVQAGTFCGKPSTAHVFASPADLARLLPAGAEVA